MIVIIDYGVGNLASIKNMLAKLGYESVVTSNHEIIKNASKLILPGVGHFDYGMLQLNNSGIKDIINQKVLIEKTPILGICLGLQLMTKGSDEGQSEGLKWIDAYCKKFYFEQSNLKVPHMGWAEVDIKKKSKLTENLQQSPRFYFVHSYYLSSNNENDILLTAKHGHDFDCAIEKENILGVQFHPEKSHKYGMIILKNFAEKY